ncbi:Fanconi anemia group M protein [Methanolinea mesophila]|uniref:DEAD/DEAH box helicase n=1 Tax=Methanolinea mesophila TaxID=547055 RepID=UPI001AE2EE02|nr:DEAD/DEAH box helicase [Methanolinea mesophila]MBP1928177.1 Fanconi anemia group M protein [Methanolinea mesophila]
MSFITHPCIRPESLEQRAYQLTIAMHAVDTHTLVVLPTGLGKTAIALLAAASRLYNEGGRVLMMAPTKPLVEQHLRFFSRYLRVPGETDHEGQFVMFTGETPPEERTALWKKARVIFATPQVIKNDVIAGSYTLDDVTLMIVDECHRAVGNYPYVFLARRYLDTAKSPRILAMTASPGGRDERVDEVCVNLGIESVESRTEHDPDVAPYVFERDIEVIGVDLPKELRHALDDLNELLESRLGYLRTLGFEVPRRQQLTMKALNVLNAQIQARIQERDATAFQAASVYAECMKLRHATSLAESQGSRVLAGYVTKLFSEGGAAAGSKASKRLAQDPVFIRLLERCMSWNEELHPKMELMRAVAREQLVLAPESRIIVFATFRDTVQQIVEFLNESGITCERFVGQANRDREKGLSQKKQIETLSRFRAGEFRVLAATSVGEEGLDVPSTDMVIFYEAVPSEIRSIQRKGRTGRSGAGKIVVLVTRGTSDEAFRYISQNRERAMVTGITRLSGKTGAGGTARDGGPGREVQTGIDSFSRPAPVVAADHRETSSRVVEVLSDLGAAISITRLEQGDYAIGDRILVERKTARDFVDTLVDRDLMGQLRRLSESCLRPVLIIEGGDLYTQRDLHPNAIRGALAAIAVDLGVSILFSRDEADTAGILFVLARRAEEGPGEKRIPLQKSYQSLREQQELVVASFPDIGARYARLLLEHFGSLQALVNADKEALMKVPGIGEKKAEKIYELSRRDYR